MQYCISQTTFRTSFEGDPVYLFQILDSHFVSENISQACSVTGISCDVNDPQAKVSGQLSNAVSFSDPFAQHTCQLNVSLVTLTLVQHYCIL